MWDDSGSNATPRSNTMRYLLAATALVLIAGGCSSEQTAAPGDVPRIPTPDAAEAPRVSRDGDGPAAADIDPCDLLTTAEIAAALDQPFEDGVLDTMDAGIFEARTCSWTSATEPFRAVSLSLTDAATFGLDLSVRDLFDEGRNVSPNARDVDGIGEDAYRDDLGLYVLQEPYYLTIGVVGPGAAGETTDEELVALARVALQRLA
jgi:hypothetical protein